MGIDFNPRIELNKGLMGLGLDPKVAKATTLQVLRELHNVYMWRSPPEQRGNYEQFANMIESMMRELEIEHRA